MTAPRKRPPSPAAFDPAAFLRVYDAIDAQLVAAGFPPTSPWWREQIERMLVRVSLGSRQWVVRVGRRGGKSSTLCRLAVVWALRGTWFVPPGDVGVIPFLSVDRDEASARLRTIREILSALAVPFSEKGDTIALTDRPVEFRVATASIRAVGFTSIAIFCDEVARWTHGAEYANPCADIIGSITPTMATQRFGFLVASSSPWSETDWHAEAFTRASEEGSPVLASYAPTWLANPTLTEERTREDARNAGQGEREWRREYLAIPGSTSSGAFDSADVRYAFANQVDPEGDALPILCVDPSSLHHDSFAWAVVVPSTAGLHVQEIHSVEAEDVTSIADVLERIEQTCSLWGIKLAFGDQREDSTLRHLFEGIGVQYMPIAWSQPSKESAINLIRRMLRERTLSFPIEGYGEGRERLRREMLAMQARLSPNGRESFNTNGLDFAATVITLAHAVNEGLVECGAAMPVPIPDLDTGGQRQLVIAGLLGSALLNGDNPEAEAMLDGLDREIFRELAQKHEQAKNLDAARETGRQFWDRYQAVSEARAAKASAPDEDTDTPADEDGD